MKVLVTYVSAGAGHRRIAEAVYNYLKDNRPDLRLELTDLLPFSSFFFSFCYQRGYSFLVHHAGWLWSFFFWITGFRLTRWVCRKFSLIINYLNCRKFSSYLIKENFDYIISTHFLNSELTANLKIRNRIQSKLVTVITDFGVHPFWVSSGTDIYIAASKITKGKLLALGVEELKIRDSGIPFASEFNKNQNRAVLAPKLGIRADMFTVLVMTGSFGSGPLEEIAEVLCSQAQVLVVCAKNDKLFSRLQKRNFENVKVFGFVDNPQELMAVSDIIVTKPGGSSIAEILNMGLFPVFISAIPGQEQENIRVLSGYGVGCSLRNPRQIEKLIVDLKNNPRQLQALKNNNSLAGNPFACKELASVIC